MSKELIKKLSNIIKEAKDIYPDVDEKIYKKHGAKNMINKDGSLKVDKTEIKIGDIVKYNNTIWVKVKDIQGNGALVSPIHKDDVELGKFGKEELVPLGSLRIVEKVHRATNENNKYKSYPITSDKTNFVNSVIIAKNSKGYLQAYLINDEVDSCVGYIVFSTNLEDYRKDYSALTGGLEELRKAWNNVDITSLANEIKDIIKRNKINESKIYRRGEINNIPDNTPVATSWLNPDGTYSSYVFKNKKGTLYDKETIKGLDDKTFKSRKAANKYALRKGYNVLESKINETQEPFTIYIYDEETGELSETISPETFQSAKTILYNLSSKNNGKLVYPRPLDATKDEAKKKSDDFKLSCSHIYQNNGNFLRRFGDLYFSKTKNESKMNETKKENYKGYTIYNTDQDTVFVNKVNGGYNVWTLGGVIENPKEIIDNIEEYENEGGSTFVNTKEELKKELSEFGITESVSKKIFDKSLSESKNKSMTIEWSYENPNQYDPLGRIYNKLIITKEQDGTFSWNETDNLEHGQGFKSAVDAFDNAVYSGEFPLEDYDDFEIEATVKDVEKFFNNVSESKINKNKRGNKMNEALDSKIKIFLTNLGKYNEGDLVGEWVELPVDDFQPILDRIGIDEEYEEWFITDYEAPFEIGEYDNIYELNEIAEAIENFDATELEVLKTCEENGYDMQTAIEKVRDNDYFYLEASNERDLAYAYIDAIGDLDSALSKEAQERYFDYEAFGRDLVLGGDYSYVQDVVDLNEFADEDTAKMVFGEYGEDKPSEEDLNKYRQWIEIYNNYDESQEEQLAEQGIEVYGREIYVDEVGYDVETLEQIVNEEYETKTGYQDNEGYIVEVYSERELAEHIVDDIYGSVSELGENTIQTYFDYELFGRDLSFDFYQTDNGYVQLD